MSHAAAHHRRDNTDGDDHQIVSGIIEAADANNRQRIHQRVRGKRGSAPDEAHQVLEDLQQAEGDQQLIFLGARVERPKQQRFDHDPDQRHRQRADRQQQKQPPERHAERDAVPDQPGGDICADRVKAAMREVDDPHDPEDQAQSRGDQKKHRAANSGSGRSGSPPVPPLDILALALPARRRGRTAKDCGKRAASIDAAAVSCVLQDAVLRTAPQHEIRLGRHSAKISS